MLAVRIGGVAFDESTDLAEMLRCIDVQFESEDR